MAGNNALNNNDSMDINELAALNEDISPELIEKLQSKLANEAQVLSESSKIDENDDTVLFEEPVEPKIVEETSIETSTAQTTTDETPAVEETPAPQEPPVQEAVKTTVEMPLPSASNIDMNDSFAQKYKQKLEQQNGSVNNEFAPQEEPAAKEENTEQSDENKENQNIDALSNGNITEKNITQSQIEYNDSLDLLDGNVKYSKYVVYIDPQNVDFIEGLTIKERKNLINRILREQDDILITGNRFKVVQTIIKHVIISIITIAISIPVIYYTINASLEASINNYRRSQSNFQTLYREKGKINAKQPWK